MAKEDETLTRSVAARLSAAGSDLACPMGQLLAWLGAWSSDWPSSFHATFGPDAQALLARAGEGVDDLGRYLKLGRIAREKLARRP